MKPFKCNILLSCFLPFLLLCFSLIGDEHDGGAAPAGEMPSDEGEAADESANADGGGDGASPNVEGGESGDAEGKEGASASAEDGEGAGDAS